MKHCKLMGLLLITSFILADFPSDWDTDSDGNFDDINNFQNSISITSAVFIDGVNSGSEGDFLAAFVDGEQRGLQSFYFVPFGPYAGTYMFPILAYSNESSGETVTFQFYDVETDTVYDVDETLPFVSDDTLGDLTEPEILNTNVVEGGDGPTSGCELPENTVFLTSSGDVLYHIPTDIAGIQFNIDGANATGASGGEAAAAGFTISAAGSTVLGFSFTGATIGADCGSLLTLTLDGDATGLSGLVFSNSGAQIIDVSYYDDGSGE